MTSRQTLACLGTIALSLLAWPAQACVEIITKNSERRAFRQADHVMLVQALSEHYTPVAQEPHLWTGVGSARVIETLKGKLAKGRVVSYRVSKGESIATLSCPERRHTTPGKRYRLYLKHKRRGDLPRILLPTDYTTW